LIFIPDGALYERFEAFPSERRIVRQANRGVSLAPSTFIGEFHNMTSTPTIDIETYLQTLETYLDRANAQAIRVFIANRAAEGRSKARQKRDAQLLAYFVTRFTSDGFQLPDASDAELARALTAVAQSNDADATKTEMERTSRRFYQR
jgi:hypothetical protein